jgi:feruloyl esterase
MKHPMWPGIYVTFLTAFALISIPAAAQQTCESLKKIEIPHVTITSATAGGSGTTLPATTGFMGGPGTTINAPYCKVVAVSAPSSDSQIGIEVWLPDAKSWNGNFLAAGNPGFMGGIGGGLAGMMQRGFVAAGTDTGHTDQEYKWAIGHPEKWADWGYRAVHEMAIVTKELANKYYGKPIKHSYWNSCHNGGNQGLNEAQRYPGDFDGIVAGDPAFWVSHLQPGSLYISWVALKDGVDGPGFLSSAKLNVLHKAALAACDKNDGLEDGLIADPPGCKFDPKSIQCKSGDAADCLTAAQVDAARKIYEGAKFKDGKPIYSGFERGSELTWYFMIEKGPFSVNINYFKGMVFQDPNWDFKTFDVDRDTRKGIDLTSKYVDGNSPDLSAFKKAGGKLIIVSSWNSLALPPRQVNEYYKEVEKKMGGLEKTQDFARLFAIPGAEGCPGFMGGAKDFDAFEAIQQWVEKGKAPDQIIYSYKDSGGEAGGTRGGGMGGGGKVTRTRPVCPSPQIAKYKGSGDINDAANFKCADK